ncbi:MAG: PAS domain S-box protein [Taibaiella sp.]|nr:PAS domain S-box protein [Taibaiella sp.]
MKTTEKTPNDLYFLQGGGEMGELIRATDWSVTPLGDPSTWPQSLRTMVPVMLDNPFGMYIAWGKEYTQLYNDSYRPILGESKHPQAVGISSRETFSEIWHIIEPMFDGVMEGNPVGFPDFMLPLNRNSYVEECYFDFSYSPIRKDNREVGGILVTVIETTNRKRAEDALKKSEERFRTMADNIPNLAWMANADGWIYWYNKTWYDYTGTTESQMEGWGWQSVHDPGELPRVLEKWQKSIDSGQPFDMIFPIKNASGSFRQFLTRILPVHNNEGKIIQWFGTNTDITEQIETEQYLKESEERFRTMAEGTDIFIATSDETGNATYFNKQWTTLTGRSMEQLLHHGWYDLIHEDDRQYFIDKYLAAFEKKENWKEEFLMLNKDEQYRWLLATGTARFLPDGSFAGYISSTIDITNRKNAEEKLKESERNLRQTILQAPVAMCILKGPEYIVELANDRMFELWGKPSDVLLHKPIFVGLPEAKDQGFEALLDGVYTTGKTFVAENVPITLPRNNTLEQVYINFVYEAYHEGDGSISGVLAVAIEVTAQVLARQKIEEIVEERTGELENTNNDLKRSNAELAQFAYIASHDLQEPLRKITTFSQMLENRLGNNIDEDAKNYLHKINASSTRMHTLIRDVLKYSELTKQTEVFEKVDLNDVLKTIVTDYELLIAQKEASVIYKDLPVIEAIPLQMSQLFSNLISNALKFSRQGVRPVITISVTIPNAPQINEFDPDQDTDYCLIQVRDNGIGFKEEYADKIFNIFQRLHRKSEYEGTGIGLAMCKKIALNHGGGLNASGSNEDGAVFNILLPFRQNAKNNP